MHGGDGGPDNNFVVTGGKAIGGVDMSAAVLIGVCLSEHEQRFSGYDARLLRPTVVPHMMRFAGRLLRWQARPRLHETFEGTSSRAAGRRNSVVRQLLQSGPYPIRVALID